MSTPTPNDRVGEERAGDERAGDDVVSEPGMIPAALRDPVSATVRREWPSARRTSDVQMSDADLDDGEGKRLIGRCRDLHTGATGEIVREAHASVHVVVGPDRVVRSFESDPVIDAIAGLSVAIGFRKAISARFDDDGAKTPLYALLDDLPVAALISGYADLYAQKPRVVERPRGSMLQSDICSGWRHDGLMMRSMREHGRIPITVGPAVPRLESPDDQWSWHPVDPLPANTMRRRRLVDVSRSDERDTLRVQAMFRDTHADDQGVETVLHEYALDTVVSTGSLEVLDIEATPRVLPWDECPAAAASARGLVGRSLHDVRTLVSAEFRGTSTCTHLNDLLRSLGSVPALLPLRDV